MKAAFSKLEPKDVKLCLSRTILDLLKKGSSNYLNMASVQSWCPWCSLRFFFNFLESTSQNYWQATLSPNCSKHFSWGIVQTYPKVHSSLPRPLMVCDRGLTFPCVPSETQNPPSGSVSLPGWNWSSTVKRRWCLIPFSISKHALIGPEVTVLFSETRSP